MVGGPLPAAEAEGIESPEDAVKPRYLLGCGYFCSFYCMRWYAVERGGARRHQPSKSSQSSSAKHGLLASSPPHSSSESLASSLSDTASSVGFAPTRTEVRVGVFRRQPALLRAAEAGDVAQLHHLLQQASDPDIQDAEGRSPVMLVCEGLARVEEGFATGTGRRFAASLERLLEGAFDVTSFLSFLQFQRRTAPSKTKTGSTGSAVAASATADASSIPVSSTGLTSPLRVPIASSSSPSSSSSSRLLSPSAKFPSSPSALSASLSASIAFRTPPPALLASTLASPANPALSSSTSVRLPASPSLVCVRLPSLTFTEFASGRTALHIAAEHGHSLSVLRLLDAGAPVHPVDHWGRTPAEVTANPACYHVLVAREAEMDERDRQSMLMVRMRWGDQRLAESGLG